MDKWTLRFGAKIASRGDCWEWTGSRDPAGYGRFSIMGNSGINLDLAHRVAYELAKGPLGPVLEVDHRCRHRWCVRPSHLEAVTLQENRIRRSASRHTKTST